MSDIQTEKYLRTMMAMMRSDAWQELLKDLNETMEVLNQVSSLNTIEDLYYRRGQIDAFSRIVNLQFELEMAQEELERESIE